MGALSMILAIALSLGLSTCVPQTAYQSEPIAGAKCQVPQAAPKPGPGVPANSTYQSNVTPPIRYRGDRSFQVQFVAPEEIERACGLTMPICGYKMMACRRGNKLILPNPCAGNAILEPYGMLACHELGHANGWPATHGD